MGRRVSQIFGKMFEQSSYVKSTYIAFVSIKLPFALKVSLRADAGVNSGIMRFQFDYIAELIKL